MKKFRTVNILSRICKTYYNKEHLENYYSLSNIFAQLQRVFTRANADLLIRLLIQSTF